jgi:ribose-phosphate pyrophosphokinase
MISIDGEQINVTMFPDKTSQVWKLPQKFIDEQYKEVRWDFEHEGELIQVCQLALLLRNPCLYMPYLPYGRQDKMVSNDATFARIIFLNIIFGSNFSRFKTFDIHSTNAGILNIEPYDVLKDVVKHFTPESICFPDKGAYDRYKPLHFLDNIVLDKDRDQATGEILGLKHAAGDVDVRDVLIVDDLCDGGRTFIEAAKLLRSFGVKRIGLYVSHGLFSKGLECLYEHIDTIYTTNSICRRNPMSHPGKLYIYNV